ncbi:exosortase/archaeosortase family protein [Vampirovibrio chlorellavorus]|uniref:exosortase/archaeosortase family protein n=1 Tax=Vampirovibrio chlorellavorus TaxID=758823 RepID=UPI0026F08D6D|nr:exosortase/archaeosortase family protein [Vampirovibrio chlorellavorus]
MKISDLRKKLTLDGLLLAVLLVLLSLPVLTSWLETLWQRPLDHNLIQLGGAIVLLFALLNSFKREALKKALTGSPLLNTSWIGLALLSGVLLVHALFDFLHIKSLYWMSYLGILAFSGWTLLGFQRFLHCLPYFLFSAFLLPVVNAEIHTAISLPLQLASTWLATQFSALFIPLTYHQNMMYIKGETFEITADCSGLQSWVGFIFAGLLKHLFEGLQKLELALLIPISLILALFLNSVRLCLTALVAYFASADQALAIHTNLDYVLLPLGFYLIWESGHWLKARFPVKGEEPNPDKAHPASSAKNRLITGITACLFLCVIVFHWVVNVPLNHPTPTTLSVPHHLADWQGSELALSEAEKKSLAGAQIINRAYHRPNQRVLLTVLQSDSPEYIHNFWGCLVGQGLQPKQVAQLKLTLNQRVYAIPVLQYEYEGRQYYEALWYQWDSGITASRWQWYQAVLQSRFGKPPSGWKIVTVTMPLPLQNPTESRQDDISILQDFSALMLKTLSPNP